MLIELPARVKAGRSRKRLGLACVLMSAPVLFSAGARAGDVKAPFITGIWATEEGCGKLAKIDGGTPRSVETVPETLTADGYTTWEGGCTFSEIKEAAPGRKWSVKTSCVEGAEEWSGDETLELDATGKRLTVTVEDKTTVFVPCDSKKGN